MRKAKKTKSVSSSSSDSSDSEEERSPKKGRKKGFSEESKNGSFGKGKAARITAKRGREIRR